jgi:intergrase/recombinase
MFTLRLKYQGRIITERVLSRSEIEFIHSKTKLKFDLEFIMESYKQYLKLDISEYRLDEYEKETGIFTIKIRKKDLENLRNNKLKDLGI